MNNSKIVEIILNIGLDVAIDKAKDKKDQIIVKERLKEYIERQKKINFHCTLEEEIDFGRLAEYVKTELLDDVKLRFWGTKKKEMLREIILGQRLLNTQKQTLNFHIKELWI